jgi:hypothetical protein
MYLIIITVVQLSFNHRCLNFEIHRVEQFTFYQLVDHISIKKTVFRANKSDNFSTNRMLLK